MKLLAAVIQLLDLAEKFLAIIEQDPLTDDERTQLRARRDSLNARLAELDRPTR